MAEIRNYTMNFGSGRPATPALTCPKGRLACAEIHLRYDLASVVPSITRYAMAEIRNYTMNFGSGRPATPALTCPKGRLACAEMHLRHHVAIAVPSITR